jgi:NAD-dependent SIR2 family protein deacetylase
MEENDRSIRELIIQYLVAHTQCSGCGESYSPQDVELRHRRGDVWLATVKCRHCGLQGLVMAAIRSDHARALQEHGDAEELAGETVDDAGPVTIDEVLDVHRQLAVFRGDVRELLSGDQSAD